MMYTRALRSSGAAFVNLSTKTVHFSLPKLEARGFFILIIHGVIKTIPFFKNSFGILIVPDYGLDQSFIQKNTLEESCVLGKLR